MTATIAFVMVATFLLFAELRVVSGAGDPILLVPGIASSQLDVRHSGFTFCNTLGQYVGLWLSDVHILKFGCFAPEMMLSFDSSSGQYSSSDSNIKVTVPGFGDTDTVETLGQGLFLNLEYFKDLVDYLVDRGYERGKSVRAAPYDWRLAPDELQRRGYHNDVKTLIETMYKDNGNTKVTITAHSLGAATMLHFLTQSGVVTQEWKDKYIGNFITLSGAWAGSNLALQTEISGVPIENNIGNAFSSFQEIGEVLADAIVDPISEILTPIARTFQSISFLLPHPSIWGENVLVTTPTRTYTANDYEDLFSDVGLTDGYTKFKGVESINENYPPPNVPTHCFYGVGVDTPLSFSYSKSFSEGAEDDPEVTMGDGDGTLTILSSEVCLQWASSDSPFTSKTFSGAAHNEIFKHNNVIIEIGKIVGASTTPTPAPGFWESLFRDLFG